MTISEIENVLADLKVRHPNLDKELLTTILLASGWESKAITDALLLFSQSPKTKAVVPQNIPPKPSEEITYYKPDGEEEGDLVVPIEDVKEIKKEEVVTPVVVPPTREDVAVVIQAVEPSLVPDAANDLPSLIQQPSEDKRSKENALPEDLPLIPFESSRHVWSFSKYKDTFHGEVMPENVTEVLGKKEQVPQVSPESISLKTEEKPLKIIDTYHPQTQKEEVTPVDHEEVLLEKEPLTKGDESLVFLAGVMLLGIILILGYMYSNGRL